MPATGSSGRWRIRSRVDRHPIVGASRRLSALHPLRSILLVHTLPPEARRRSSAGQLGARTPTFGAGHGVGWWRRTMTEVLSVDGRPCRGPIDSEGTRWTGERTAMVVAGGGWPASPPPSSWPRPGGGSPCSNGSRPMARSVRVSASRPMAWRPPGPSASRTRSGTSPTGPPMPATRTGPAGGWSASVRRRRGSGSRRRCGACTASACTPSYWRRRARPGSSCSPARRSPTSGRARRAPSRRSCAGAPGPGSTKCTVTWWSAPLGSTAPSGGPWCRGARSGLGAARAGGRSSPTPSSTAG